MHHLALVVDACRARDKYVATVAILHVAAPLEADAILRGGIQMGRSIEVAHLPRHKA